MRPSPVSSITLARMAGLYAFGFLFGLGLSAPAVFAQDLLPLAQDRAMATLVQTPTDAPIPAGATVEVIGQNDKGIPKPLRITGVVLGTIDSVVFLEVRPQYAAYLAHARQTQTLKLRKTADPDASTVAQRIPVENHPFVVAPFMRSFTVPATAAPDLIAQLKPGTPVALSRTPEGDTKSVQLHTVFTFLAASEAENGLFDITLAAHESPAINAMAAAQNGSLSLTREVELSDTRRRNCYITQRHSSQIRRIAIPCS